MCKTALLGVLISLTSWLSAASVPDLGPNVIIFGPESDATKVQDTCNKIFEEQFSNQFGKQRYAILFKPGEYKADITVGFYTQVAGLGKNPDKVVINGVLKTKAFEANTNVTQNFWRSCENFTVKLPENKKALWAVSQAAPMRRMHITGDLWLFIGGWASGGWLSDSKIDGKLVSGSQQQWLTRNCTVGGWQGGVWNMVHMGVAGAPVETGLWDKKHPHTVIAKTPVICEKPFLQMADDGTLGVFVPGQKKDSVGHGWGDATEPGTWLSLDTFHIARADQDTAATMNAALSSGKNLLVTPGIYRLNESLKVTKENTVVLGLGMASLLPTDGNPALDVADVDGVRIAGLLIDAGAKESPYMVQVGAPGSTKRHDANPTYLYDVFCRVGGAGVANAKVAVIINSNDVVGDHTWIWRADHGEGAGWESSRAKNGLIVNGANVTYYGLFVEHFQEYQTVWNGENGRMVFYQCEIPYDIPSQEAWMNGKTKGWAAYKVADSVKQHRAEGMGIYSYFRDADVTLTTSIETPKTDGVTFRHLVGFWLTGKEHSSVDHVINDVGDASTKANRDVRVKAYPNENSGSL